MSYHRSRSIPTSSYGGTTIAADPTLTEGGSRTNSSRRGRSRSISHVSNDAAVVASPSMRRSRSRSNSMRGRRSIAGTPPTEPPRRIGCSTNFPSIPRESIRRRRSAAEGVRSTSPDDQGNRCKPKKSDGKECTTNEPITKGAALRRTMTAPAPLRSALKKSSSNDVLPTTSTAEGDGKQQSKTCLGIAAIASGIIKDVHEQQNGPCPFPLLRSSTSLALDNRTTKKRQVTFASDAIDVDSSETSSSLSCGCKSSVEESLRRMRDLQQKFRRSSQEGINISEAEQARLAKEVQLLSIAPSLTSAPAPAPAPRNSSSTSTSSRCTQERKTHKATPQPAAGRGKSAAAMSA